MSRDKDNNQRPADPFSDVAEEGNPIKILGRFVDDEIASLFSAFGSLRPHFQRSFEELEKDHQVAWQRFTKNYERATSPERTRIQPRTGEEEESHTARQLPLPMLFRSIFDDEEGNVQRSHRSATPEHCPYISSSRPSPAREEDTATSVQHPTTHFLAFSPYSPRNLESDPATAERGDRWRRAFEDLLHAEEEGEDHKIHRPTPAEASPTSWIAELQHRGSASRTMDLRDVQRDESRAEDAFNSRSDERDAEERHSDRTEHLTELDLYEHFLGGKRPARQQQQDRNHPTMASITSTLTTTERRCLPDGTTTTKTVLKKRFADGSETSEETIDTTHAPARPKRPILDDAVRPPKIRAAIEAESKKSNSWFPGFWSSS